jgi:hypothetical protein
MGLYGLLGDRFTYYMLMMFVYHKKYAYGPPRSVTGMVLLSSLPKNSTLNISTIINAQKHSGMNHYTALTDRQ